MDKVKDAFFIGVNIGEFGDSQSYLRHDSSFSSYLILKGSDIALNNVSYMGELILEGTNKLLDVSIMSGSKNHGVTLHTGIGFQRSRIELNELKESVQIGFSKPRNYPVVIEGMNLLLIRDFFKSPANLKILVDSEEKLIKFDLCTEFKIDLTDPRYRLPWLRNPIIEIKNANQLAQDLPHEYQTDFCELLKKWGN